MDKFIHSDMTAMHGITATMDFPINLNCGGKIIDKRDLGFRVDSYLYCPIFMCEEKFSSFEVAVQVN